MNPISSTISLDLHQYQTKLLHQRQTIIKQFECVLNNKIIKTINYPDKSIYCGEVTNNGERSGIGMLTNVDGSIYLGRWKSNTYHHKGIYIYPDGQRYQGHISQLLKQGHGIMYYINGDYYQGKWYRDQPSGQGLLTCRLNRLVANGVWENGKFIHGIVDSKEYVGEWAYGGPHGKGKYIFEDGSVYEGDWVLGEKSGFGRYNYANGDCYEGDFKWGLKHGKGRYRYSTRDEYEGQFINDYKQNYGVMKFMNGCQYRGQWQKDNFDGQGTYLFNNQQQLKAVFRYGVPLVGQQAKNYLDVKKNRKEDKMQSRVRIGVGDSYRIDEMNGKYGYRFKI